MKIGKLARSWPLATSRPRHMGIDCIGAMLVDNLRSESCVRLDQAFGLSPTDDTCPLAISIRHDRFLFRAKYSCFLFSCFIEGNRSDTCNSSMAFHQSSLTPTQTNRNIRAMSRWKTINDTLNKVCKCFYPSLAKCQKTIISLDPVILVLLFFFFFLNFVILFFIEFLVNF